MNIQPSIPGASPMAVAQPAPTLGPAPTQVQPLQESLRESAFTREDRAEAIAAEHSRAASQQQIQADFEASILPPIDDAMRTRLADGNRTLEALGPVGRHLQNAKEIEARMNECSRQGLPADHPWMRDAQLSVYQELMAAQAHAQTAGLSLEAAAKIIEAGTSGVRTVLQTQT